MNAADRAGEDSTVQLFFWTVTPVSVPNCIVLTIPSFLGVIRLPNESSKQVYLKKIRAHLFHVDYLRHYFVKQCIENNIVRAEAECVDDALLCACVRFLRSQTFTMSHGGGAGRAGVRYRRS